MGRGAVFDVKNVSKSFRANKVLRNFSLNVQREEVLGIIGASGSGKTTLLNLIVGFLPPDSGEVVFHQRLADGTSRSFNVLSKPMEVNRSYGFAAQRPSFYEKLTVRENLAYFGAMYNLAQRSVKSNSEILIKLMGLVPSQHTLASDLSGGMKRRLDIACALVHNPSVLILDEPTAELDPMLRMQILEIVKRINQRGTTIILSSHHLNEIDALCNRIAILKDGELADLDTPDKLKLKHARVQEILIESYPGNYEKLLPELARSVRSVARQGTYLVIRTEEPQRLLREVLAALERHGERLLDIRLNKPNLDDVFLTIYEKEGKNGITKSSIKNENGTQEK